MSKSITYCAEHPDRPAVGRGLCGTCYSRHRRAGTLPSRTQPTAEELLAKAREGRQDDECWPWPGNVSTTSGYGRVRVNRVLQHAHRWAYATMVAPVPDDLEVDHVCHSRDSTCLGGPGCRHRPCVNYLRHLEPVLNRENWMRGRSRSRRNLDKNQCPRGHAYDGVSNTVRDGIVRRCLTCARLSNLGLLPPLA